MSPDFDPQSTRPYLVRAIYEWCTDMHFTPHVTVYVDETVQVPREFVRGNEIVLNISFEATTGLQLNNECIQFKARFGGVAREIMVPMSRVAAIYAVENSQGMSFPMPPPATVKSGPVLQALNRVQPATDGGASTTEGSAKARVLQLVQLGTDVQSESEQGNRVAAETQTSTEDDPEGDPPPKTPSPIGGGRPSLTRVK